MHGPIRSCKMFPFEINDPKYCLLDGKLDTNWMDGRKNRSKVPLNGKNYPIVQIFVNIIKNVLKLSRRD